MDNFIYAYWQAIVNGSVRVGKWIRLLYEKIINGIEDGTYIFDAKKAGRAIEFIEKFVHHNKGKLAPGKLKLALFQRALISVIFGIVDENGIRIFREVFCVIGRKCGKTLLASAIMACCAYLEPEYGKEIYAVAPKLDQADLVYSAFKFTVEHETVFDSRTRSRKNDLYIEETNTTVKKVPFSDRKSDGYNPYLVVADEVSSWPGERGIKQYQVFLSGAGAREQPIFLSISSGGYENEGIYDDIFRRGTAWLQGNSKETHLLPVIYMVDDESKWDDINELQKSLPGLGVSVPVNFILDEINTAYGSISKRLEFLTKYCNIRTSSVASWLEAKDIKKSFPPCNYKLEDFADTYACAGVDLSISTDLCAAVLLIERDGKIYYFTRFFLPKNKIEEATIRDQIPYRAYIERGFLIPSGENQIDYEDIFRWFTDLIEKYQIYVLKVGYDRYNALYWVKQMKDYGFHMDDVVQGGNLTGVIIDTEAALKDGRLICAEDNDLMKLHWMDSALKMDEETNRRRLVKIHKNKHIDGVAAMLDAMCMRHNYLEELGEQLANRGD